MGVTLLKISEIIVNEKNQLIMNSAAWGVLVCAICGNTNMLLLV